MENLTSVSDHSDFLSASTYSDSEKWELHRKRVRFGKQPLEIWHLLPCDQKGNILEEPKCEIYYSGSPGDCHRSKECGINEDPFFEYQQAKERCWFEGYNGKMYQLKDLIFLNLTVENMVKYGLKLTASAKKEMGL